MSPELLIVSATGASAAMHVRSEDGLTLARANPGWPVWATDLSRGEAPPPVDRSQGLLATSGHFRESRQIGPWSAPASATGVIRQATRVPPEPPPSGPPSRQSGIRRGSAPAFEPRFPTPIQ